MCQIWKYKKGFLKSPSSHPKEIQKAFVMFIKSMLKLRAVVYIPIDWGSYVPIPIFLLVKE